ncbi:hypothetical protein VD659_15055 [Herbiconiux sp. 11R-BC]|uniref:hypothetical protein n=1 Tax=Herbiconiux sp. 11R-BC TaxID=3111637 RepID=UPI003C01671C
MSIQSLARDGILHPEWSTELTEVQSRSYAAILGAEPPVDGRSWYAGEALATKFLTLLDGTLEAAVIQHFCAVAGREFKTTFRLVSGTDLRRLYLPDATRLRTIDLVIIDSAEWNDDESAGAPARDAVVAIECKFEAQVNYGDCGGHGDGLLYGNQIVCYPNGCSSSAVVAPQVGFVWLGLPNAHGDVVWPPVSAMNPRWIELQRSRGASAGTLALYTDLLALQTEVVESGIWTVTGWPALYDLVEEKLGEAHPHAVAPVLRALGARPAYRAAGSREHR